MKYDYKRQELYLIISRSVKSQVLISFSFIHLFINLLKHAGTIEYMNIQEAREGKGLSKDRVGLK